MFTLQCSSKLIYSFNVSTAIKKLNWSFAVEQSYEAAVLTSNLDTVIEMQLGVGDAQKCSCAHPVGRLWTNNRKHRDAGNRVWRPCSSRRRNARLSGCSYPDCKVLTAKLISAMVRGSLVLRRQGPLGGKQDRPPGYAISIKCCQKAALTRAEWNNLCRDQTAGKFTETTHWYPI